MPEYQFNIEVKVALFIHAEASNEEEALEIAKQKAMQLDDDDPIVNEILSSKLYDSWGEEEEMEEEDENEEDCEDCGRNWLICTCEEEE